MSNPKSFDVWLAVKPTVEVVASEQGQSPWEGDAVRRGADWLTKVVQDASFDTPYVAFAEETIDLTDAAVRFLNQSGVVVRGQAPISSQEGASDRTDDTKPAFLQQA